MASWNVKSFNNKEQEILQELENQKIDIAALQETKKKSRGQRIYGEYIVIYSGVEKSERAKEGVAIALHKRYINQIESCQHISSRIVLLKLLTDSSPLNILSIYAPDENKAKQKREDFYKELERIIESLPPRERVVILGDFNARIGHQPIPGIRQRFNEQTLNENGKLMIDFCSLNGFRITNTFFNHKEQHKYTFSNTRGQRSTIDYILTNSYIPSSGILDVRTLNSADVGSDHSLLLGKFRIKCQHKRKDQSHVTNEETIKIDTFWDTTTRELYKRRLREKIELNPADNRDEVNTIWLKLKTNIKSAAIEALGTKKCKKRGVAKIKLHGSAKR
ncbi:craniofacial development protein 2-like [Polistes fuscatus]|uniref:craniofacial development protein 2-like n=1 Tax=Polistes fuscatus TaxID=30207 RepID=UPI001CA92B7E|nr:craniofacial development protein 2-like [Polistes fuscatus]